MRYLYFLLFIVLIIACSSQKEISSESKKVVSNVEAEDDSISYELIVLDQGFETWFLTHAKASWYQSQDYYENWNYRYVTAWNHKEMGYRHAQLLDGYIDYDSNTDYGLEINHKLFYYFQYVEHVLNIPIIRGGPKQAFF